MNLNIPALTGLRAIAAFMVYFHHFHIDLLNFERIQINIQNELYLGVTIFFVLSGFLLTLRYANEFTSEYDFKRNLKLFIFKRFARIYPIYIFLVVITLVLENNTNIKDWILNLTLLKGLLYNHKFSGISQSWSLTVEECFYFTLPLLILYRNRTITVLLLIGISLFTLKILTNDEYLEFLTFYTYLGRSFEFLTGVFFGLIYLKKGCFDSVLNLKGKTFVGMVGVVILLIFLTFLSSCYNSQYSIRLPLGLLINNYLLPIFVGMFLLGLATETTKVSIFLSNKLMLILGKSSFVFYLIHLGFVQVWLADFALGNMINFIILIIISIVFYFLIEQPLHRFFIKLFTK